MSAYLLCVRLCLHLSYFSFPCADQSRARHASAGVPELCSLVRVAGVAESVCLGSRSVSVSQK